MGPERLTVFGDVVEVVAADDDRSVHFGRNDTAGEDAATNGDLASERAFLVWVDQGHTESVIKFDQQKTYRCKCR